MPAKQLPSGITFSDEQSRVNFDAALKESPLRIIAITGRKASGKTRLARHILSIADPGNEHIPHHSPEIVYSTDRFTNLIWKRPFLWIDNFVPKKFRRGIHPIPIPDALPASPILIIIAGECVPLTSNMELLALRIHLA